MAGCASEDNDPVNPPSVMVEPAMMIARGIVYQTAPEPMKLDLYRPTATTRPAPLVVVLHGGAWVGGRRDGRIETEICRSLAEAGFVAASVSYYVGGGGETDWWPRNLEDCRRAIRFLRGHAGEYGIDPAHVGVIGDSAGGHLAMMLGFTGAGQDRVGAVVEMYAVADLLRRQGTDDDGVPDGTFYDSHAARMLGASATADPARWRAASPVTFVSPASPPVLVIHGTADTSVDRNQAAILDRALTAAGVNHQTVLLPGIGHAFDLERWGTELLPIDLRPVVASFLRRAFQAKN